MTQPYAWGSHTAIAELQGRPAPTAQPEAELWMGAHPAGPSGVDRPGGRTTLAALIAADPAGELGAGVAARFGGRLPFLLKVLAAEHSLSIQVHPSRAQAEAGFRAENERGLPLGDKSRNYADDWPKPEILCALTRFEILAGLRSTADAAALLGALDVPALGPLAAGLSRTADPAALAEVLATVLTWPAAGRADLVGAVTAGCQRVAAQGGAYAAACAATGRIAADHPGDLGVVASLLLRHAVLEPGTAVFMPAGGLHAYLHGTGVELLANSDNVVRAGLTGKHVDVPELLKLVDPGAEVPVIEPRPAGGSICRYDAPAPEFRLYRAVLGGAAERGPGGTAPGEALPGTGGPRLVLCTEGAAVLRSGPDTLPLAHGQSCFLSAADEPVRAAGPAVLFIAACGDESAG